MSKYTTEVRFICEQMAGLSESEGWNSVDEIIKNSYDKIFDVPSIPFFNADHRTLLLQKILLYYYTREIGFETVGLWKMKLNEKMRRIMPYYNQLYQSELLNYDPLKNVDNTHTHAGEYEDNSKVDNIGDTTDTETRNLTTTDDGSSSFNKDTDVLLKHSKKIEHDDDTVSLGDDTTNHTTSKDGSSWTEFSDTPQGGLDGVRNGNYLTNATHITETPAETQSKTTHGKTTNTYGDVTETYNPNNNNNKDHTDEEGWDKTDNTNTHTGTINNTIHHVDDNNKNDTGTDRYTNNEYGKIGTETYQEMVIKYRETFLNIDDMIIRELGDLFMKVW